MLAEKYLWEVQYEGNFKNKEATIALYEKFNEQIIATIPKKRLLVFDLSKGWNPLCEFLEVPVPNEDFPFKNKRKDFKEQMGRMLSTGEKLELK